MSTQTATPELRHWILEQARAGHAPEAVLQAMRQSGWEEDVALSALEQTLEGFLAEQARQQVPPPATPVPEPVTRATLRSVMESPGWMNGRKRLTTVRQPDAHFRYCGPAGLSPQRPARPV